VNNAAYDMVAQRGACGLSNSNFTPQRRIRGCRDGLLLYDGPSRFIYLCYYLNQTIFFFFFVFGVTLSVTEILLLM